MVLRVMITPSAASRATGPCRPSSARVEDSFGPSRIPFCRRTCSSDVDEAVEKCDSAKNAARRGHARWSEARTVDRIAGRKGAGDATRWTTAKGPGGTSYLSANSFRSSRPASARWPRRADMINGSFRLVDQRDLRDADDLVVRVVRSPRVPSRLRRAREVVFRKYRFARATRRRASGPRPASAE